MKKSAIFWGVSALAIVGIAGVAIPMAVDLTIHSTVATDTTASASQLPIDASNYDTTNITAIVAESEAKVLAEKLAAEEKETARIATEEAQRVARLETQRIAQLRAEYGQSRALEKELARVYVIQFGAGCQIHYPNEHTNAVAKSRCWNRIMSRSKREGSDRLLRDESFFANVHGTVSEVTQTFHDDIDAKYDALCAAAGGC